MARELWVALASMFSSQSLSCVNNIRTTLINAQKGNQSVASFFAAMRGLADELTGAGKPIQDDELMSYIIHGLDQDYQPLVSALDARVTPVTLEELFSMLSNFDQRMAQYHGSGGGFKSSANSCIQRLRWRPSLAYLFPWQGEVRIRRWWLLQQPSRRRTLRQLQRTSRWRLQEIPSGLALLSNLWQAWPYGARLLVPLRGR
ncbi:unnamed protein product [Triticum aestivum]|uniref:Uncharacterized protein n=1 Tax=Triticum aestivum TaxID=4565 RepID=A0A7H4LBH6_WHEAT|nr:unnamed protein product [Triticum aestivum]